MRLKNETERQKWKKWKTNPSSEKIEKFIIEN
jgi:hypothetical protein